jgi:prolyl oligopeptidase
MADPSRSYPLSPAVDQVDDYHGTPVADPYRWLEDPDSDDSQAWIAAQNRVTFAYLDQRSERTAIRDRLTQLWNYEKFGTPFKVGDRYFYFKNDGLQNQSVLYTLPHLDATPQVLLDPNTLSKDGTVALTSFAISENAQYIAYGLSSSGSDWQEWRVRAIESGEDLTDQLRWVKFSGASWSHDHQGFFYSRYDEPSADNQFEAVNYYQKLYYHRLGTPQSDDILIYHRPDEKEWGFSGSVSDDGRLLTISVWRGTEPKNLLFYKDLTVADSPVVELIHDFEAEFNVIDVEGDRLWVQTDLDAPRGRLIAIDLSQPDRAHWQELIPQATDTLQSVSVINHELIATYLKDAQSHVQRFTLDGTPLGELPLPGIGSVGGFSGKRQDTETFYSYTSYTTPTRIYRYDAITGESQLFRQPSVAFNPDDYTTTQVFYPSADGTAIPMFITHKAGLALDGNNPTLLYGYGGFGVSLTPGFSPSYLVWMEMGGIYAVPNLRGGGEYGEDWHQAGTKHRKQTVFDDFIAAAEWLIAQGYTRPEKLAIAGGSNGGLLVGACMTQRPELFGAALPAVGVMDMLRFHQFTIGWAWCSEYGSPDNAEDFPILYAYSPLHNLKPGTAYPATLITTADHDDRVVPAHSFKFAAALQAAHAGDAPVLIRIETNAGHGAGKPTAKVLDEVADRYAFLVGTLGIDAPSFPQPTLTPPKPE